MTTSLDLKTVEAGPEFKVWSGQRQLFLDDYGIAQIEGLKRTMHQPEKKGAVIRVAPGISGLEQHSIQTISTPAWDPQEQVWKLWVSVPNNVGIGYWESKDGLHWVPKNVGLVEVGGSTENHHLLFECNGQQVGPDMVVYDPTDPDPSRRYKTAKPNVGFGVSPDGVHWKGLDGIPGVPSQDTWHFSLDEQEHLFILKVKHTGPYGRSAWLSTSHDFQQWTEPEMILHADELDQEIGRREIERRYADPTLAAPEFSVPETANVQIYNMAIFRYESLYVGLPMMFYQSARVQKDWDGFDEMDLPEPILDRVHRSGDWTGVHLVQLTCSRDLSNWERLGNREPFIGPSRLDSGAYDTLCIACPSYPAVRGDELWFYYVGIKTYAISSLRFRDQGAICLAVLRRDGFVSLDAGEVEGIVLTKPFTLPGGKLFVNVDAPHGSLRVEALDMGEQVVAVSSPLGGDLPREEVKWEDGTLEALEGQKVALRFRLRDASLYSYWLE